METTRAGEGFATQMQECAQLIATNSVPFRFCQALRTTLPGAISVWGLETKQGELDKLRCFVSLGTTLMVPYA